MNIVRITENAANEIHKRIFTFETSVYAKYTNLDHVTLKDFRVTVDTKKISFVDMWIQVIPIADLPEGIMPDIVGDGHVIHYVNFYDKRNADANFYDLKAIVPEDDFAKCSIYVRPQIVQKNGQNMLDLYMEQAADDEVCDDFTDIQKLRRSIMALLVLDYVDSRVKKDRHRIKRMMPTPEQKEKADKAGIEYKSEPIRIKDVSVQYIYVPHESRKYERHCEAWGVRGHWRHYKSGKVVFIKPHTKGSGRVKDTVYSI